MDERTIIGIACLGGMITGTLAAWHTGAYRMRSSADYVVMAVILATGVTGFALILVSIW